MSVIDDQKLEYLKNKARDLPFTPGVYIMKDSGGHIIYIGKAKALRRRVSQYFFRFEQHVGKVRKMVEHVNDFEYILTDSEFEALILECSLIKQNKPKYNILLKDDKGYSYIKITLNEKWPRIESAKQKNDDGATYIGPYISGFVVKEAVDEAIKAFALPTCSRSFEKGEMNLRPCLNYFIHQCCAPCRGRMTNAEYREIINDAVTFLRGGYDMVIAQLTENMEKLAENLQFEKAARLRDRIVAIKRIRDKQKVVASKVKEQDVIALAGDGINTDIEVFIIRDGRLCDRESYLLDFSDDEKSARAEFIQRYYSQLKKPPVRITLDGETDDRALLEQYLSEIAGRKVAITVPQKGEQAALTAMVKNNAEEKISKIAARPAKAEKVLDELGKLLGLSKRPDYIESYDISNTAGTNTVAGMIVFENGQPLKSAYRKFTIKTVVGQDDYACMREVLSRRLERLRQAQSENGGDEAKFGFGKKPDLILLDGGIGQVNAVSPLMEEYGFDIPLFGMVKDDKHRTRAIAANGGEIAINANKNVFAFVTHIQDEVHRFAITYHRKTRSNKTISSRLTAAPQIGEARARALLRKFKSVEKLRSASVEEIAEVPGMSETSAQALKAWLETVE